MSAAAALEFTLGLQVNKFLEGIGLSTTKLLGLISVTEALGKVMDGVWRQIEKGAALNDLSKRTGESVATLYQLQKAFTAAGVPADSIGTTLFQMQKALGGVSESGEDTNETFKKLGLNLHDLKQMSSGQAFKQIIGGLAKQDNNTAAKSASTIFGRSGAADAVQMSRSAEEFQEAFDRAAKTAQTFARVSETFDRLEKSAARLKEIFAPIFLGIAKYIAEPLDQAITKLNSIDLSPIGEKIGAWISLILDAFSSGQLGEILQLSIQVALEKASFYAQKFGLTLAAIIVEAIGVAIPAGWKLGKDAIANIGEKASIQADEKAAETAREQAKFMRSGKGAYGAMTKDAREWLANGQDERANTLEMSANDLRAGGNQRRKEITDSLRSDFSTGIQSAIQNVKDVYNSSGDAPETDASKTLNERIAAQRAKFEAANPIPKVEGNTPDNTVPEEFTAAAPKPDNIFARMGFVTNGTSSTDYSRKTADSTSEISSNTARMSESLDRMSTLNVHSLA